MEKVAEATQEQAPTATAEQAAAPTQSGQMQQKKEGSFEETGDMGQFEDLFEESLKTFQAGEIIEGRVVRIDKEHVMVDVGYKSEGRIPVSEFLGENGEVMVSPGDKIEILLEDWDPVDGRLSISYSKALRRQIWQDILKAYENGTPVRGIISSKVKGGLSVQIGEKRAGVKAFLPFSQIDIRPVNDPDGFMGKAVDCLILKCNRKRENIVVSRRALLEKERDEKKRQTLSSLAEGQVIEGVVKNVTDYGVFVDIGGIDGLLHITDISWGRIEHPSKQFKAGDKIKVKVLSYTPENEKVSLGIKQLTEDPWLRVAEKYPVGERVKGKVVSLTDYGAFVELEEGVEGLIHVSEMSWAKRIRHPSQILKVGERVEAVVLKVDPEAKRISLGLKQIEPNPWDLVEERYPVGTVIEGTVKNVTDFGVFIGIEEGIDGLVHVSDLSWSKKINHPGDLYRKGDRIQAVVLNVDKEKERFSLGVKQLQPDPWTTITERFPVGRIVTGKVTNVTDFGVFVELEEGVEGLIHVSEVATGKVKTPMGMFEIGSEVSAKVIHVAPLERRIGLSIKRINEDSERSYFEEYSSATASKRGAATLGSLLQEELAQQGIVRSKSEERRG
ncbi:30S ribosomal protein S1 [Dissulfurimicrobium hydrothermale]|uniref:30S ribosomal protein S1 n=1 Tax=Dissulfurimicrobium hydrothermale TaxID=1750598 RepID=UPI001EDC187F|nr:30S ribosomal protein S1 [Dissulfurimicrobium hydrothermale]UKL14048.1 30S ribosomal protein S1 [Dissulfurimicrobium hydrothermale]